MAGRKPDPQAADAGSWTVLPAAGREGDAPDWPLSKATARELKLWRDEWRRPQAVQWEANSQQIEVALYVRTLVAAERRTAPAAIRNLVKQQMEYLGISQPGMLRLRWLIGPAESVPPMTDQPVEADGTASEDVRKRFRVVA